MSGIRRRVKWSRKGVSEIIGNILILGITVTLFSSVMYFVANMPPPQENAYADFSVAPRWIHGGQVSVNITHVGGQELKNSTTRIVFSFNQRQQVLNISDSRNPAIGTNWVTGVTGGFSVNLIPGETGSEPLSIMIIDTDKNNIVWSGTVAGGVVGQGVKPIIGTRGTTPSPAYADDQITLFATVTDPDGDLIANSVYIDLSSIGFSSQKMRASASSGVFVAGPFAAQLEWNGKTVIINATDSKGNQETGLMTLTIYQKGGASGPSYGPYGPYINYSSYMVNGTYPPDASGGESGGAGGFVGTAFYYIREADHYSTITRVFNPGERILIEVYSDALDNIGLQNEFTMTNPYNGDPLVPPSSSSAFGYGGVFGTFHRYNCTFTAPDLGSALVLPFQIKLKDTTGDIINIVDYIQIEKSGVLASYPMLQIYRGNTTTGHFEDTKGNFSLTDTIYVRILTQDVDSNLANLVVGNIEISDYSGRYIINTPPSAFTASPNPPGYSSPPVSSMFKTTLSSINRVADSTTGAGVAYTFFFNPKDAYQGWWLPRTNAYTIRISMISDQGTPVGELYYDITSHINITAPLTTTDIVASIGSGYYTWSSSGAQWTNNKLAWFSSTERSDQWNRITISDPTYAGPIGLAMSDIDNDGYNDLIVGYQDPNVNVAWFRNPTDGSSNWNGPYIIASPGFDALPGPQAANNAQAYPSGSTTHGNDDEDTTVYSAYGNYYLSSYNGEDFYCQNEVAGALAIGDFDGDGQKDVVVSYVHTVVWSDATSRSQGNQPGHSFPMFFNRGIYVYWGSTWQRTQLYGTDGWIAAGTSNSNSNPAALDLATGDFNQDGYDDIVAVYENGQTQVWFSQYQQVGGDRTKIFGAGSNMMVQATVAGTNPWDHTGRMPSVRVANMDSNGYPDIIRTSTARTVHVAASIA